MNESLPAPNQQPADEPSSIQSLRELIDLVTGRAFQPQVSEEDAGLAERLPFPFLALVGQAEMKLALLISVINPLVSGVLLIGPRGTGKTTAVRSLIDLLPSVERSACYYGCLPEDIEAGGMDAVCPECARKYGEGQPLTRVDRGRLVELPLNARLEDVIGGLDERATAQNRMRLKSGILKQADLNVLYIDEVNLLADDITNAILDAAAQGSYTVRRGPIASTYRARFTLIGSMNPEEGSLRPQIIDRFGLRVLVRGLTQPEERLEAYYRSRAYYLNQRAMAAHYQEDTLLAQEEIQQARALLPSVTLPENVALAGTRLIQHLGIDSLRAEVTLFEAARALAAADGRASVSIDDLGVIAPLALRLRQSPFMIKYFSDQSVEEQRLMDTLGSVLQKQEPASSEGKHGETGQ
jgi:magnesium chelatase subunit I